MQATGFAEARQLEVLEAQEEFFVEEDDYEVDHEYEEDDDDHVDDYEPVHSSIHPEQDSTYSIVWTMR